MKGFEISFWPENWKDPSLQRTKKPRSQGLTMMIDKGLGQHAVQDLFALAADYIDIMKLGFGTSALYPIKQLQHKIALAKQYNVAVMPGGTFFEVVSTLASIESYVLKVKELGFTAIEISDGTLPIGTEERQLAITLAAEAGLTVYSEFGKKDSDFRVELGSLLQTLEKDLAAGAAYVIVEARETGTVGVFNKQGELDFSFLRDVHTAAGKNADRLIWEAPQKDQQVVLLRTLGLDVNLGNIAPADILSVETLRRGLRGDTSAFVLHERSTAICE